MGEIKCKVEECRFNKENKCFAGAIEVRSSGGDTMVDTSDGTACDTFQRLDYGNREMPPRDNTEGTLR